MSTGLVLGGGGLTGVAWEIGILTGLADAGIDLTGTDVVVGTSAGAVVTAQITSGTPLPELFRRQVESHGREIAAKLGGMTALSIGVLALRYRHDPERFRRRLGTMALAADTVPSAERLAVIESRLPSQEWPDRDIRITAVDAVSGAFEVFTRESGVRLAEAVAASCAVPTVWPPVTIGDRAFIDGGMCSAANVDVAAGCDRVIVVAPITLGAGAMVSAEHQIEALRSAGTQAMLISPDKASHHAIGSNVLDPARRAPSAQAGRDQAATIADDVRAFWTADTLR